MPERVIVPAEGQPITLINQRMEIPNRPIIPFIEGDGTGPDIWRAAQQLLCK
jgi:isocitrate dehydrogenase